MTDIEALIAEVGELKVDEPDQQVFAVIQLGIEAKKNPALRHRVVEILTEALSSAVQALVRAHAADELGKFRDPHAIPALIKAVADKYRLVRSYAVRALGEMDDVAVLQAVDKLLDRLMNDDFFGVRAEAAEALGKILSYRRGDATLRDRIEDGVNQYEQEELFNLEHRFDRVMKELNNARRALSKADPAKRKALASSILQGTKNMQTAQEEMLRLTQ